VELMLGEAESVLRVQPAESSSSMGGRLVRSIRSMRWWNSLNALELPGGLWSVFALRMWH